MDARGDVSAGNRGVRLMFTLLHIGACGSVLLAMLFHTSWNLAPEIVLYSGFSGADWDRAFTLYVAGGIAAALFATAAAWGKLTRSEASTGVAVAVGAPPWRCGLIRRHVDKRTVGAHNGARGAGQREDLRARMAGVVAVVAVRGYARAAGCGSGVWVLAGLPVLLGTDEATGGAPFRIVVVLTLCWSRSSGS